MSHTLELLVKPHAIVRQIISNGLGEFHRASLMPEPRTEDLAVVIRDSATREVLGGLWGRTGWEWLTIELIFIPEHLESQDIAGQLIGMAEEEALKRGCHSAWLHTLHPGTLSLYERQGYERFGELKNFPQGHSRFFLQKKLMAHVDDAVQEATPELPA